ncbi:MAG TPA: SigE family RNA polymerase sigma factor [Marmoricola sp.]
MAKEASRDEPEFGDFMRARWQHLFGTAYLLTGNREDAEELLQDAMARTCARWDSIRDKAAADAYVRRTMTHQAMRGWRRRGRERVTDTVPDTGHDGGLHDREQQIVLWERIHRLPPRMRAVLVLRYFEDLTEAQTAEELSCSVGTVKSQAHRALAKLRDDLVVEPALAAISVCKGE